jgi:dolichol-phosphate mannosyltransferase
MKALKTKGVNSILFANKVSKSLEKSENVGEITFCWRPGVLYPFSIFRKVLAKDVNVIHVQHEFFLYGGIFSAMVFPLLLFLLRLIKKPTVVTIHGVISIYKVNDRMLAESGLKGSPFLFKLGLLLLVKAIVALSSNIIVTGHFFSCILQEQYKCSKNKIHVISHVDPLEYNINPLDTKEAKTKLKLSKKKIVLFFGYLAKYKGIEILIEAFKLISEKKSDVCLIICGGEHPRLRFDPSYRSYLLKLQAMASSCCGEVIFTGYVKEEKVALFFSACDVVVIPYSVSLSSSGPLALALRYKKNVIVPNDPAFLEHITLRDMVFKKNSAEDLATKLMRILYEPRIKAKVSTYLKNHNKISWSEAASKTIALYKQTLQLGYVNNETKNFQRRVIQRPKTDTKITVVIPTYNEHKNLEILIPQLLEMKRYIEKIILVDDGSNDGTIELLQNYRKKHNGLIILIERGRRLGVGTAILEGIRTARTKYVLTIDADLNHPVSAIPNFIKQADEKRWDIIIGSRYINGGAYLNGDNIRKAIDLLGNKIVKNVLGLPFNDVTSGFKLAKRDVILKCNITDKRGEWNISAINRAYRMGASITEIPVEFQPRKIGTSKHNLVISMFTYMKATWREWWLNQRYKFYNGNSRD